MSVLLQVQQHVADLLRQWATAGDLPGLQAARVTAEPYTDFEPADIVEARCNVVLGPMEMLGVTRATSEAKPMYAVGLCRNVGLDGGRPVAGAVAEFVDTMHRMAGRLSRHRFGGFKVTRVYTLEPWRLDLLKQGILQSYLLVEMLATEGNT